MRPFKLGLSLLLLVPIASRLAADEAADYMKFYSWWKGSWTLEARAEGSDEVQTSEMKVTSPGGNSLVSEGGRTCVWGFDPKRKKWVGTGFGSDGSFMTTIFDRHQPTEVTPGTMIRATYKVKNADGTVATGEEIWHYIDANTAEVTQRTKSETGEDLPTQTFLCKRKN